MKKITRIAAIVALLSLCCNAASASTTLPLNTGYNHSVFAPYAVGAQDNYWINIASYPSAAYPPLPAPSWVVSPVGGWWTGPFPPPGGGWINGRNTSASAPGVDASNPGYTIFRKCFCLLPGFKEARLRFTARADNSLQVWLNTQLNQVLAPSVGNFGPGSPPLSAGTEKGFRTGKNCVYALVEDQGGAMGFFMEGHVTAVGLLPTPAAGAAQSFAPCSCQSGLTVGPATAVTRDGAVALGRERAPAVEEDEQQVIDAIVKIAEARRVSRPRER